MATIQIEAEMSTEQLLHVVEQLPPREFAVLLAKLLERDGFKNIGEAVGKE